MVIPLWLAACDASSDLTNVIRGIQVVAVEPSPAEPAPDETLTLTAWVADGIGRGTDVLVWVCTPVDGHCLESGLALDLALPLSLWTRVGGADPAFVSTNPWPQLVALAGEVVSLPGEDRGGLLVWVLACAPGVCPIVDRVTADPEPGSSAWLETERMLADPASWIDGLPRGQVSLALKSVGVYLTSDSEDGSWRDPGPPNRAPTLEPTVIHEDRLTKFRVGDPDGDPLLIRSFTTAGGVSQTRSGDTGLGVLWEEPLRPGREAVRFVVAEDGRGGTAVWCSEPTAGCNRSSITFGSEADPLRPGDPLRVEGSYAGEFWLPFEVRSPTPIRQLTARVLLDGRTIAGVTDLFESGTDRCASQSGLLMIPIVDGDPEAVCEMLGRVATVELVLAPENGDPPFSSAIPVVITGSDTLGCAF